MSPRRTLGAQLLEKALLGHWPEGSLPKARVTQEHAAIALGVTQQTVSDWIAGGSIPGGQNLIRLLKTFSIPIEAWGEPATKDRPKRRTRSSGAIASKRTGPRRTALARTGTEG